MRHLTLQRKAFLALSALMALMLLMFVGLSRLGLQRGMGPYVAEIELARMDWFAVRLQHLHAQHGGWQTLRTQPDLWLDLRRPEMPGTAVFGPSSSPATIPLTASRPLLDDWVVDPRPASGGTGLRPPPYGAVPPPWALGDGGGASRPEALSPSQGGGAGGARTAPFSDGLSQRLGLIDNDRQLIAGTPPQPGHARTVLRNAEGRPIGQLVLSPPLVLEREADQAFLGQQLVFVVWTGAAGLAFALVLSWWLGRRWLAPVGALVAGARSIAAGRLDTRVAAQGGGHELARLVDTFNHMAEQLASMEASRRQWIGDVAHELRTPLAAMRAEIEAVQDGVRQFDDNTALRLHRQVMRLTHLVGDLRASLDADGSGQPGATDPVHPLPLLAEAVASMQPRFEQAGVGLQASGLAGSGNQPLVRGDAQQLHRVFLNLLENSLRYTDRGGRLEVTAAVERGTGAGPVLSLRFDDTAPGVPAPELPRIFERLYRAEASRTRANGDRGGSGLGLAICRAIVQAHGGHIGAEASPLGGLRIHLTLPLLERTA